MTRSVHSFPTQPVDTLVIGAGVGGLACAARLARASHRVLVIDQHFLAGGYCTSFHRRGFTLDACIDTICGARPGSQFWRVLEGTGVASRVRFLQQDPIRENVFGALSIKIPAAMDAYEAALARRWRKQARGLHELFVVMRELLQGMLMVPVEAIWNGGAYERVFPALARWKRATWRELLEHHVHDELLISVLSERCSYVGLPPSRVSALSMATMFVAYFEGGTWRVAGGYQRLADAFVESIRAAGSSVELGHRVERLLVEKGRVVGVALGDGREIRARRVVSGADARATLLSMLGREHLAPGIVDALERREPSLSFVVVHVGVKRDLSGLPYAPSMGYFPGGSVERSFTFARPVADDPDLGMGILVPTNVDRSLAPAGQSILSIHYLCPPRGHGAPFDVHAAANASPAAAAAAKAQKEELARTLVRRAEALIPGVLDHAEFVSVATPRTMWRYTLNEDGAAYGFEQTPERFALLEQLRASLPAGLHLCGHWTDWGGGVVAASCSGFEEARRILTAEERRRRATAAASARSPL
jgi:phytoene dehydrogenase-like protein